MYNDFRLLTFATAFLQKQVKTTADQFVNGVLITGEETTVFEPFPANSEPFTKGEKSMVLPSGVSSKDAYILFTSTSLKTHNDLKNTATVADVVYLDDPETDQAAHAYIVFDKANWRRNSGMKLLSTHGEYLIIRKEKVSL